MYPAFDDLKRRLARREIPCLNGLRAIAVAAVIADHGGLPLPFLHGGHGVMLFFVLSGFLITWLLLQEQSRYGSVSLTNFYIRRSLRILPVCYAYVGLIVAVLLIVKTPVAWGHAISSLFYYSNYYYAFTRDVIGWLQHLWSLAVEEQFYLLWPVVFVLFRRKPDRLVTALLLALPCTWAIRAGLSLADVPDRYVYRAFEARADQLLIGCLMAVLIHRGIGRRCWHLLCQWPALAGCIALFEVSSYLGYTYAPYRFAVGSTLEAPLLGAILIQSVVLLDRVLERAPLRYIGRISYGMYLFHELGGAVSTRLAPGSVGLRVVIAFAATAAISAASFHLFEAPILRLKDKWQKPRTAPAPVREAAPAPAC